MQFRFLCPRHRQWLLDTPAEAGPVWQAGMESAQRLLASGEWGGALLHVGSAYETALLMTSNAAHCAPVWLRRHEAARNLLHMVTEMLGRKTAPASPTLH